MNSEFISILKLLGRILVHPRECVQSQKLLDYEKKAMDTILKIIYFFMGVITMFKMPSFSVSYLLIPFFVAVIGYLIVYLGIVIECAIINKFVINGIDKEDYTKLVLPYYIISIVALMIINTPGITLISFIGQIIIGFWAIAQRFIIFKYHFGVDQIKRNGILIFVIINIINMGFKLWLVLR